jgi:hypothetical protein
MVEKFNLCGVELFFMLSERLFLVVLNKQSKNISVEKKLIITGKLVESKCSMQTVWMRLACNGQ